MIFDEDHACVCWSPPRFPQSPVALNGEVVLSLLQIHSGNKFVTLAEAKALVARPASQVHTLPCLVFVAEDRKLRFNGAWRANAA